MNNMQAKSLFSKFTQTSNKKKNSIKILRPIKYNRDKEYL